MNTVPFSPESPLHELPALSDEVFFVYHPPANAFVYLNAAFEKVWELSPEAVKENVALLFHTIHPDDATHVTNSVTALLNDGNRLCIQFRIITPQQKAEKWIQVSAYTSTNGSKAFIMGMAADISAIKQYSDVLHRFADKKNTVLQILTHDLLGPLGNIDLSIAILLGDDKLKDDTTLRELITVIQRNSRKSVRMIRDLINDEFLQTSEVSLHKQRIDMVGKVRFIIDQYQFSPHPLPQQRVKLVTALKKLFIPLDEAKFTQVITNLLSNAVKFTPDTGSVTVTIEDKGDKVLMIVEDNGIGIPDHLKPILFDKFTLAGRQGLHGEPSTGLGMSIIKKIIEWHGGRIWFTSEEGRGTTFFVELPKGF